MTMRNRFDPPVSANEKNTLVSEGSEGDSNLFDSITLKVLAADPTTTVDGQLWRTSAGLRGKIGSAEGTFTFVAD